MNKLMINPAPFSLGYKPEPFDRHNLEHSKKYLGKLRGRGRRRLWDFNNGYNSHYPNTYYGVRSTAFENVNIMRATDGNQVLLDAGCGESADADIALVTGYKRAYAVDLFGPLNPFVKFKAEFLLGDICEKLPIRKGTVDVIVSNWVLPLIHKDERHLFYKEAYRLLKLGGLLSIAADGLVAGYGNDIGVFRLKNEIPTLTREGFVLLDKGANYLILKSTPPKAIGGDEK